MTKRRQTKHQHQRVLCTGRTGEMSQTKPAAAANLAQFAQRLNDLQRAVHGLATQVGLNFDPKPGDWIDESQLTVFLTPKAADGSGGELVGALRSFAPPCFAPLRESGCGTRSDEHHDGTTTATQTRPGRV
jgi:hypothetical protein